MLGSCYILAGHRRPWSRQQTFQLGLEWLQTQKLEPLVMPECRGYLSLHSSAPHLKSMTRMRMDRTRPNGVAISLD